MKINYFQDTDTLYIELEKARTAVAETRDLDEHTLVDVDDTGKILAITFEHASERADIHRVKLNGIAA